MILALTFVVAGLLEDWRDQINFRGWDASLLEIGKCPQLIARIPSTTNNVENAILLHATTRDPQLLSARVHVEAVQKIPTRKRDIYIAITCGGEETAIFIHAFLRKLENFYYDLTTADRVQIAVLGKLFPMIEKVKFVWNEGAPIDNKTFSPWIMAPVGTAQRGLWSGSVKLQAKVNAGTQAELWSSLNGRLMDSVDDLVKHGETSEWSWRALHDEHEQLASRMGRADLFWDRVLDFFNERSFYFRRGWEWMLDQQWQAPTMSLFSEKGFADVDLELRFLGTKEEPEIESLIGSVFRKHFGDTASIEVQTLHLSPFLRSVYEGIEARTFERSIREQPNMIPVPVISPSLTESKLFREVSLSTYEFSPYIGREAFFSPRGYSSKAISPEELQKAVDFEVSILKELVE